MRDNIEKVIRKVNGTMSLEGMSLAEEDKQRIRNLESGKTTIGKEIRNLNAKYLNKRII